MFYEEYNIRNQQITIEGNDIFGYESIILDITR